MNELKFTYEFDPDDEVGWLGVEVRTDRFSGRGGCWVQWQEVEKFGQSLRTYPIRSEAPLIGAWGIEQWEGDGVRIEVAPANSRGYLKISVEVSDRDERSEQLRTSFQTHYPQLEAFSDGVGKLMKREASEAVLLGI